MDSSELVDVLRLVASRLDEARDRLGELDGEIGDADHGRSMSQGLSAVCRDTQEAAARGASPSDLLLIASRSFLDAVGATTGPLYASAFARAADRLSDRAELGDRALVEILEAMAEGIAKRGGASPGDKTMMDAFGPAARAASAVVAEGGSVREALRSASVAAAEGSEATRAMVASKGRAARLGARSLGHLDPGAVSAAILVEAFHEAHERMLVRRDSAG